MFGRQESSDSAYLRATYDELYTRGWLPDRAALLGWIVCLLDGRPGQAVLDVACGDGQMAVAARRAGLTYYGVDFSAVAVRAVPEGWGLVADGQRLPVADGCLDFVTCIGSLEHFVDMDQGVREMARVLRPDGRACVLLPNAFGLTWNLPHVWRTGDVADEDGQPVQRFGTRLAWQRLLEENGLVVFATLGYESSRPRGMAGWKQVIAHPRQALLALVGLVVPLNLAENFVFLCRRGGVGSTAGLVPRDRGRRQFPLR